MRVIYLGWSCVGLLVIGLVSCTQFDQVHTLSAQHKLYPEVQVVRATEPFQLQAYAARVGEQVEPNQKIAHGDNDHVQAMLSATQAQKILVDHQLTQAHQRASLLSVLIEAPDRETLDRLCAKASCQTIRSEQTRLQLALTRQQQRAIQLKALQAQTPLLQDQHQFRKKQVTRHQALYRKNAISRQVLEATKAELSASQLAELQHEHQVMQQASASQEMWHQTIEELLMARDFAQSKKDQLLLQRMQLGMQELQFEQQIAVKSVFSPIAGKLIRWVAKPGAVMVGEPVAAIEPEGRYSVFEASVHPNIAWQLQQGNDLILHLVVDGGQVISLPNSLHQLQITEEGEWRLKVQHLEALKVNDRPLKEGVEVRMDVQTQSYSAWGWLMAKLGIQG